MLRKPGQAHGVRLRFQQEVPCAAGRHHETEGVRLTVVVDPSVAIALSRVITGFVYPYQRHGPTNSSVSISPC
jgi:hypothetical protein